MSHKLLVTLVLVFPGLAIAQDPVDPPVEDPPVGTEDPSGTEEAPTNAQDLRAELEQTELTLQKARDVLSYLESQSSAEQATAQQAQRDVQSARSDLDLAVTKANAAADVAWYGVEKDRDALRAAQQVKKLRKAELRLARKRGDHELVSLARSELNMARQDVAARKSDLEVSRAEYRQAHADRKRVVDEQERSVASARAKRSAALDRADVVVSSVDLARARVDMLEAKRARILAQLSYNEARRVLGEDQDLQDLSQALQAAREREDAAIVRLRELERAAGPSAEQGSPTEPKSP